MVRDKRGRYSKGSYPINGFKYGHQLHLGKKHSQSTRDKISEATKGKSRGGKKPRYCKICNGEYKTYSRNQTFCSVECHNKFQLINPKNKGKYSARWRGGLRKVNNERNDSLYQFWVQEVKKRDGDKCALKDEYCSGYNIVHHILTWSEYPKLRYKINNGITLCQHHHPRKRDDVIRLVPFFRKLVRSGEII